MNRKRVLMCTEASYLPTGYSVYTKEVLSRLQQNPNLEIAELGCYSDGSEEGAKKIPWKFYPNKPLRDTSGWDIYQSTPTNCFGEYRFHETLLDFMPDFVMDIRDWWMIEYQQRSPFREFFNWSIMPTVDAEPQHAEWVQTYGEANAVFTYSEFGHSTLKNQCEDLNFKGIAPPCASDSFKPVIDKFSHRNTFGLKENATIFGTVMRNQRRKLFPDLFKCFREFLDQTNDDNAFLYCHTSYPDVGWLIPELLIKYDLLNRVLFTYRCKHCGVVKPSFFSDVISFCPDCATFNKAIIGVNNPISEEDLASIYNLFDLYIQYANSEGFGMPQLEAAQCGSLVASVDYSAMASVIKNIDAIRLPVASYSQECETGCHRANPDNKALIDLMVNMSSKPRKYFIEEGMKLRARTLAHYNWDKTASIWEEYFINTPCIDRKSTWLSGPRKFQPTTELPSAKLSVKDQVNYMFHNVLGIPQWIGGPVWRRMIRDLTYKATVTSTGGEYYFNESHTHDKMHFNPFDLNIAFNSLVELRNIYNSYEDMRINKIQTLAEEGQPNVS